MIPDLSFRDEEEDDDEEEDESEEGTPVKVSVSDDLWWFVTQFKYECEISQSLSQAKKPAAKPQTPSQNGKSNTPAPKQVRVQHPQYAQGTWIYLSLTVEHKVHWGDQAPPLPECTRLDKHV